MHSHPSRTSADRPKFQRGRASTPRASARFQSSASRNLRAEKMIQPPLLARHCVANSRIQLEGVVDGVRESGISKVRALSAGAHDLFEIVARNCRTHVPRPIPPERCGF